MRIQIPYGSSAAPLHFEFPLEWTADDITAVTLTITDRDNAELMAADALTLYTDTTLLTAASRYADSVVLAALAGDLSIGDKIRLTGIEGSEVCRVKGWDTDLETAKLEIILDLSYEAGDSVVALFGDYSLDVSDTEVFYAGCDMIFTLTPAGSGGEVTVMGQISKHALDIVGLRTALEDSFPRVYKAYTDPLDRFDRMAGMAERRLSQDLRQSNIDIQRIVDQSELIDAVVAEMAWLWTMNGDDDMEMERKFIGTERSERRTAIKNLPIFFDDNQDGAENEGEITSHEWSPDRSWS
jgi:hypothetical protein